MLPIQPSEITSFFKSMLGDTPRRLAVQWMHFTSDFMVKPGEKITISA